MSSGSKKVKKAGDRATKGKKGDKVAQPSSSTVPRQDNPASNKGSSASPSARNDSQLTLAEQKLHDEADRKFQAVDIKDRKNSTPSKSQPVTRESSPVDMDLIVGDGKWSWPHSTLGLGYDFQRQPLDIGLHKNMLEQGIDGLAIKQDIQKAMIKQALHMSAAYQTAVELQPNLKGDFLGHTRTAYYLRLKERLKTMTSFAERMDRFERASESTKPPTIEYLGAMGKLVEMRMWGLRPPEKFDKGLESPTARCEHLFACFNSADKKAPATATEAKRDIASASRLIDEHDELPHHPEYLRFKSGMGQSLIIHGNDPRHKGEPTSALTPLFFKSYKILNESNIVLTHSTGLSVAGRKYNIDHLKSSSGLIRSLCAQLLAHEDVQDCFSTTWLTKKRLEDARSKKYARNCLAMFFRDLILDVADIAAAQDVQKAVIVIIDGIDRLEKEKTLLDLLALFRGVADELEFGPLGEHITFKYLLLHPGVSRTAVEQHPRERHLFCLRTAEEPHEQSIASSSRKKGKSKAKSAKTPVQAEYHSSDEDEESSSEIKTRSKEHELVLHLLHAQLFVNPHPNKFLLLPLKAAVKTERDAKAQVMKQRQSALISRMYYPFPNDAAALPTTDGGLALLGNTFDAEVRLWPSHEFDVKYAEGFLTPEARSKALLRALYGAENHELIANEKHYDRQNVMQLAKQEHFSRRAELACEHPEMVNFSRNPTGALIIHGMDSTYAKSAINPVTPCLGLLSYTAVAQPNVVRLTYAAGLDLVHNQGGKAKRCGTAACLRQMCFQMLQSPFFQTQDPTLRCVNNTEMLAVVEQGPVPALFMLFRFLILDIASLVHENKELKKQIVEVVIDSVDWLEESSGYVLLIQCFRKLIDEIHRSGIERIIGFRYLIFHSGICDPLVSRPHIHERHLFWKGAAPAATLITEGEHIGTDEAFALQSRKEQITYLADAMELLFENVDRSASGIEKVFEQRDIDLRLLKQEFKAGRCTPVKFPEYRKDLGPVTFSSSHILKIFTHTTNYDTPGKRRRELESVLDGGLRGGSRAALAKEERRVCAKEYMDPYVQEVLRLLFLAEEMRKFRYGQTMGLMIHDAEIPGTKVVITGEVTERTLAAWINLFYFDETRVGSMVLTHVMGTHAAKRGVDEVRDAAGILRSLCWQLIELAFKKYKKPLEMEYMDISVSDDIENGKVPVLCRLFRDLVCDLAMYLAKTGKGKQRIVVVIDCAQLENTEDLGIHSIAECLRSICNEAEVCELGQYIDLRYMLLRPATRHVGIYTIERHIFMKDVLKEVQIESFQDTEKRDRGQEDLDHELELDG